MRLQEPIDLSNDRVLTLLDVLGGVSLDYSIVAQKSGAAEILAATNPAFEGKYGLTLETLATRYDQQAEAKAEAKANKLQTDLDTVHAANNRHWQFIEEREKQIQAILQSHSWRITAPLRWAFTILRRLIPSAMKAHIKNFLRHAAEYLTARLKLRNAVLVIFDHE